MKRVGRYAVSCVALVSAVVVACSATRPDDDERSGSVEEAVHADAAVDANDGGCRTVTLRALHRCEHEDDEHGRSDRGDGCHDDDDDNEARVSISPPMAIRIPASIDLTERDPHAKHTAELSFKTSSHREVECRYESGPSAPASRAVLVGCSDRSHAGDLVTITSAELSIEHDGAVVATVTLTDANCTADAGADAGRDAAADAEAGADGGGADAGADGGADAGGDAGPTCSPANCQPTGPCDVATCVQNACTHAPAANGTTCSDGSACTRTDSCQNGTCVGTNPVVCTATDACHAAGVCDPATGLCSNPTAPNGSPCSDGSACTLTDTCQNGSCIGANPVVCGASDACHVPGICDPATGLCSNPPAPNDLPCDDGSACTQSDACQNGICVGVNAVVCSASDACHVAGVCDPTTGVCSNPAAPDGTPCGTTTNLCTGTPTCASGTCMPAAPLPIDDGDPCTADGCSPSTGPTHVPIAGCAPTPPPGENPFEPRASVIGRLVSAAGAPITGATFTIREAPPPDGSGVTRSDLSVSSAGDGSFRVRLTSFASVETEGNPPLHVIIRIDAPGVLPVFRDAWLHTGTAADLGVIKMIARDPAVTLIGPAGGTASDSRGLVEVVIPPNAVATTIPVQITPTLARDELPAVLPPSTSTMFGVVLEPDGATFSAPVTVRFANRIDVPTSVAIPTGFYDPITARWEDLGQAAIWDGSRFSFQTSHFTIWDANAAPPNDPVPAPTPPPPNDPRCQGPACLPCASEVTLKAGAVRQTFALPSYRVRSEDFSLTLTYDSGLAGSRELGAAPSDYGAVGRDVLSVSIDPLRMRVVPVPASSTNSFVGRQPGLCAPSATSALGQLPPIPLVFEQTIAGSTSTETFTVSDRNKEAESGRFLHLPLAGAVPSSPGLFTAHAVVRAQSPGSCIASGGTFGVMDALAAGVQTNLEPGPLATFDRHVLVNHRSSSPFGKGWAIAEASRVYKSGDTAYLTNGDGSTESFRPRAYPRLLGGLDSFDNYQPARDPVTGEVLVAAISGAGGFIARVDVTTGATTTLLSGLPFVESTGLGPQAFAIGYVGSQRHFLVWVDTQLLDIDSGGSATLVATRTPTSQFQNGNVAVHGDVVVLTDGVTPVLRTFGLSDPTHAVTTLSSPSGGDVRLFPKATLSGVSFADPRGVAFAADGTLYVTDLRRNALYAVRPQTGGAIGPNSVVDLVMGNGRGTFLAPLGERYPGTELTLGEPLFVDVAEDGTVFAFTTYGAAAFDPVSREAEWLAYFASADEMVLIPSLTGAVGFVALSRNTLVTRLAMRIDIDLLSSQFEPTRTLSRLPGGGLELLDTTAATIERFDAAGRLVEKRQRTGELVMTIAYVDAASDRIDRVGDAVGGQNVFSYDGAGKLQTITDARGRTTTVSVDGGGDLVTLQKPDFETYQFGYTDHRLTSKETPKHDVTTYAFRANGTVDTIVKPEGESFSFDPALSHPATFDATGALVRASNYTDGRGVLHTLEMNARGEADVDTYTASGEARLERNVYAANVGDRTLNRQSRVNTLRVSHRTVNDVALSPPIDFWDDHYRPFRQHALQGGSASIGNINDDVHLWCYTSDGFLRAERTGSAAFEQVFDRDAAGHVTRVYDSDGAIDAVNFQCGNASATPFPVAGQIMDYTYRADGQVATARQSGDGTRNYVKTFTYDDAGGTLNHLGWTDSLGRSLALTLDAAGNVTQTFDGTATTHATFDAVNRLATRSDALGNTTTYGYAFAGCGCSQESLVTSIHTPDLPAGVDWTMTYDGQDRLASVTDPHGFTESYQYEPTGELKVLTDKLLRPTTYSHDQLGRVLSMLDTLGRNHTNVYALPASGAWSGPTLMAGSADATSATTSLTGSLRNGDYQIGQNGYADQGYPALVSLYQDATFQLALSRQFDANRRMTLKKDRAGEPIDSLVHPTFASTGGFWGSNDGWSVFTSAPVPVGFSSPISGDRSSYSQNVFFEFTLDDGFGKGLGNAEADVQTQYRRDDGGRVTELHRRMNGVGGVPLITDVPSFYTYRPDGRIARLVNPDGTHDFTYNSRGLVETQVVSGEGTYSFGYDEMSRNNLLTFPDGHTRTQAFDELGRVTSRCYDYTALGGAVRCYGASYDAVGNPVRMTDPDGVDVLEYDALDRLTKLTRFQPDGVTVASVEDYAFNALGALKTNAGVALDDQRPKLAGGGTADAAVPASLGGQPVNLNAGGFVTSLRGTSFTWSERGFLREAQDPIPAALEHYGYDSDFRKLSKQQGADTEFYVYEGMDRVAIIDATGAPKETYLFDGIDHPLRITQSATSTTAYYELDLAGNVRALRASGGSDLGGYRYTAFGKTALDTTTITQPLRWKGRWFSSVAGGIYDVRARQWAPELGVFLAVDEFHYHRPHVTLWGWPNQNPARFTDPNGHGIKRYGECIERLRKAGVPWEDAFLLCIPDLLTPDPSDPPPPPPPPPPQGPYRQPPQPDPQPAKPENCAALWNFVYEDCIERHPRMFFLCGTEADAAAAACEERNKTLKAPTKCPIPVTPMPFPAPIPPFPLPAPAPVPLPVP
jgi:RHS repeat-associated protein